MKRLFIFCIVPLLACGGKIDSSSGDLDPIPVDAGIDARVYVYYPPQPFPEEDGSPGIPLGDWPCLPCPKPDLPPTHQNR